MVKQMDWLTGEFAHPTPGGARLCTHGAISVAAPLNGWRARSRNLGNTADEMHAQLQRKLQVDAPACAGCPHTHVTMEHRMVDDTVVARAACPHRTCTQDVRWADIQPEPRTWADYEIKLGACAPISNDLPATAADTW